MSILKVARLGHPVLRTKARPVTPAEILSPRLQQFIDDLIDTMREYSGIGLAAPQVHESLRLFVAGVKPGPVGPEITGEGDMPLITLINPEIHPVGSARTEDWEGCLSIPDIRGRVPRANEIRVRAFDRDGERIEFRATGLPGRVIQHEYDHLDGVLFFDRMRSLETLTFLDEYSRYWAKDDDE
jgi:peptide deformylase